MALAQAIRGANGQAEGPAAAQTFFFPAAPSHCAEKEQNQTQRCVLSQMGPTAFKHLPVAVKLWLQS